MKIRCLVTGKLSSVIRAVRKIKSLRDFKSRSYLYRILHSSFKPSVRQLISFFFFLYLEQSPRCLKLTDRTKEDNKHRADDNYYQSMRIPLSKEANTRRQ